jgi:Tol biopolymer transport system component
VALIARPASATPPGKNALIAFSRYRFVNSPVRKEIWVAKPDGSGLRQITRAPANTLDYDPSWAPGGSKLLFSRCAPRNGSICDGEQSIWVVNADGTDPRMLTPLCRSTTATPSSNCPQDGEAVYSPDGQIAATRFTGVPGIAIGDGDFRHVHELFPFGTKPGAPDIDASAWSPDGKQLAFTVHNDNGKRYKPVGGRAIFVVNTDGTGLRRITPWTLNAGGLGELDWSPDGTRILFHAIAQSLDDPSLSTGDLYTIRPDGTGLKRLTHFSEGVQLGSYSPDGKQIVFATEQGAVTSSDSSYPDVFTMDANGDNIRPVTRTKNWEGTPSWGAG